MVDVPTRPGRACGRLLRLVILAGLGFAAPCTTIAAASEATDNAIDLTLQAASAAGGFELSTPERNLVKSVMGCAIDGASLEDCGRQVLVGQLGQLPPPAKDLTDCLLKKGTLETCGQQAVIKTLGLPPELRDAANCVATAAVNGGAAGDCVRKGVVGAISKQDPSVGQVADCLLQHKPVAGCATAALMSQIGTQLGPDAGPAATCLIRKQDPTQCTAELAKAGGIANLPPEVSCVSNKTPAAIQACLQQSVIDRLPGDPNQKALARCMMDPAQAPGCATKQLAASLPPGAVDAANCIATQVNPATCTGRMAKGAAGGLGDSLDTLGKMMGSTRLVDPGKAPSSLANLLLVAKGVRDGNWRDVIEYGGAELYKAAGKIVLDVVIPIPGLSALAGPILDTMVQDRLDLVDGLLKEAQKCSKLDPSRCDAARMGELLGEFYMLMQIEIPCSLLSQFPPAVRQVTCGALGAAIEATASTAYDIYKDNDKELAGIAAVLFPGSGIGEAILALDPDVENAVIGKDAECPANYFSSHVAVCFKDAAFLGMVDPGREAALIKNANDACRHAFLNCSKRNPAGKLLDCAGGLFGGDGCHADDSDRISKQCDPLKDALGKAADDLRKRAMALAAEYAAADNMPTPKDQCAPIENIIGGFVARCAAALPAKLPGINGGSFATCSAAPQGMPPADLFGAACRAAAMDKVRQQRNVILVAKGIRTNQAPDVLDGQFNRICGACELYGSGAVSEAKQNAGSQCGGTGPRWTTNFMEHKQWCLAVPDAAVQAEDQARQDETRSCLTCQDYANRAMKSARTNVADNCGGTGPRYSLNPADHIGFCRSAQPFEMAHENDERVIFLRQCIRNVVAAGAPAASPADCVPTVVVNTDTCNDPNRRRDASGKCFACQPGQHFDASGQCAQCEPGFHIINHQDCVSDRVQPVTPACATPAPAASPAPVLSPPRPPLQPSPTPPAAQLPPPRPPLQPLPTPAATCPGDLKPIGTQCSCPAGLVRTADNRCVPPVAPAPVTQPAPTPPAAQPPRPNPPGGPDQGPCRDPNQRRGADGVCFSCSHNDHFDASNHCVPCQAGSHVEGDACVADKTPAAGGGTQAPPAPTTCPADRPVGTPPNCCPRGREPRGGNCVSSCPPGYKVLDAPDKYGSFCEAAAAPTAPAVCDKSKGEVLFPDGNCACPAGTGRYGANGGCAKPGTVTCDPPFIGMKPDCACPAGQQQQGFKCVAGRPAPAPAPAPAPVGPAPRKCVEVPSDCLHYTTVPGSIAGKVCDRFGPPKLDCSGAAPSQPR